MIVSRALFFSFFIALLLSGVALAQPCRWGSATISGSLDASVLDEASGLAVSRQFSDRLYHVNDSGDGPFFYLSNARGGNLQAVRIAGFNARNADVEDIAIGPCSIGSCLFVGNIGDNLEIRDSIEVFVIAEQMEYSDVALPLQRLELSYPDGPHNAEAMAVHPNGDIYILTKESDDGSRRALPAKLYKIASSQWQEASGVQTLSFVGELDLPALSPSLLGYFTRVVTALDISPDGKRFLVLTYENAFEFFFAQAPVQLKPTRQLREGVDYLAIRLRRLPQQEGIAYVDNRSFLYDTEALGSAPEIRLVECLD